jgi:NAD(P)-dependent dehydrogenase (short-subunit alcohol dehydrogenase family)
MRSAGDLTGLRAIVTGASRGVGRAVAEALLDRGALVVATARTREALSPLAARPGPAPEALVGGDLGTPAVAARVAREAVAALGGVDVLVNNAGVIGARMPLATYPVDRWDEVMAVNVTGALVMIQGVVPAMPRGGAIINVTSGAAGRPTWGAYAISKLCVDGITGMLREELAPRGIRCVAINPGPARTAMRAAAYPDEDPATVPDPAELVGPFLAVAAGADPGPHLEASRWRT